jgi:hypothetical protein
MRNVLRTVRGQVYPSTEAGLPRLSGAELAWSSWAKRIESCLELPEAYKDFFAPFLAAGRQFPYSILTPSYERFVHRTSEKLICDFDDNVYVLEKNGNSLEVQCYPVGRISYVEFRTALLASSFKICGGNSQGVYASSTLIFNSVTDYLFTPILKRIRRAKRESTKLEDSSKPGQFEHLATINFKFMNYANHSLLGEEKVIHSILQPEIREKILTVLRKTYDRMVSPTHMSILTDRELIMIREQAVGRKGDRYGGVWDYIPLSKIVSLALHEKNGKLMVLSIQLPNSDHLEFLFQIFAREAVNQLIDRFREVTGASLSAAQVA